MIISNTDLSYVKTLSSKMKNHNFMLSYRGAFTQDITKSILSITERKLDLDGTEVPVKKKVFNVMVECLQNICKHSEKEDSKSALFMIGKIGSQYVIYSGNVISNENVNELQNKLIAINSMSREELKSLYITLISSIKFSASGGAGLGLIDIAKKSGSTLDYDFFKIDDQNSFFTLRTSIVAN
jgi:hypothetical protein